MKFHYLDSVVVHDGGFFQGTEGEVTDSEKWWDNSTATYQYRYQVRFLADKTEHWFSEGLLRKVAKQ